MTNEISGSTANAYKSSTGQTGAFNKANLTLNQTTPGRQADSVSIGTTEQDVIFTVTTPGWLSMMNLDPVNFVEWGPKDTTMTVVGKLLGGKGRASLAEFYVADSVTLRMKADTAACILEFAVHER